MEVRRIEVHNYLVMDLNYSEKRSFEVSITKYIGKILRYFPEEIKLSSAKQEAEHLFQFIEGNKIKPLPEEQSVAFYHTVAHILFVSTISIRNVYTAVAFLTTWVNYPDEDD